MYAHDEPGDQWSQLPPAAQVEVATNSLRMLADPGRLRMLWLLSGDEYDVASLAEAIGIARPAVAQHPAKLRLARLGSQRRGGGRGAFRGRGGAVRRLLGGGRNAPAPH